ncbi:MAG: acetyl-CoA hydrolase/transferase C-terminal domain-containing protein [bacterium]
MGFNRENRYRSPDELVDVAVPEPSSELERRLVEPIYDRVFGDYPGLDYARDQERGNLPDNVDVKEFYFVPGSRLNNTEAQQNHLNINFTHAVRDIVRHGVDVIAQLVTPARELDSHSEPVHSLSCNADLTLDLIEALKQEPRADEEFLVLGQVNENLPFMYGDCLKSSESFDGILKSEEYHYKLFGPPPESIDEVSYAIGMHASQLVRDGGTLQIGIGSLSNALARMLIIREQENDTYREMVNHEWERSKEVQRLIDENGSLDPFEDGLYGSTEMLVPGFLELYEAGILSRTVYDNRTLQQYVNDRNGDRTITEELIERLLYSHDINARLTSGDMEFLRRYGIVKEDVCLDGGSIQLPEGETIGRDLNDRETRSRFVDRALSDRLSGGVHAHGGFFLGPQSMYETLRQMDDEERRQIRMTRISFINDLYDDQPLAEVQRIDARFMNSAMKVTLLGGVASETLDDGRVVSGVGGQYNFVSMAHALDNGRSVIMLPSTRTSGGKTVSNIVWNYGNMTIGRHLRDIVVTEYGLADLRGRTDRGVVEQMLSVTDARFQDELVSKAKQAGKLPSDWSIPESYRENTPEKIKNWYEQFRDRGYLEPFPFGTDLTEDEITIGRALRELKRRWEQTDFSLHDIGTIGSSLKPAEDQHRFLERMDLADTSTWQEWLQQKMFLTALNLSEESE